MEVRLTEDFSDKKEDSVPKSLNRKKRIRNRPSKTQLNQHRKSSNSTSEDVSVASSSGDPSTMGAAALAGASSAKASSEWDPHDKTDYRDKVTSMIAAKAREMLDNKMKDFDKLQKEKEELQEELRVKEKQFDAHMVKVTEISDDTAKKMTKYLSDISKTEDEKAQNDKDIKKLDHDLVDLEAQIVKIKEKKRELAGKSSQCDAQIEKMERKRKGLENFVDKEMTNMMAKKAAIIEDIKRINKSLCSSIKATEDLARFISLTRFILVKSCIFQDGCCGDCSSRRRDQQDEGLPVQDHQGEEGTPGVPRVPGDGGGAHLHMSGDASYLRQLSAQVERLPRVSGALPSSAPETQVSGQLSPTSDDK